MNNAKYTGHGGLNVLGLFHEGDSFGRLHRGTAGHGSCGTKK